MKKIFLTLIIFVMLISSVTIVGRALVDGKSTSNSSKILDTSKEHITTGKSTKRGYVVDNILHSEKFGDIHFSSYIPKCYDKSKAYVLFITLPGWGGLYFQGVGVNIIQEDFGVEARKYKQDMIILAPQLNDWGDTSANQTIALAEYFIKNYNIDKKKVYLEGFSGGGETGSLAVGKRPDLFSRFLHVSSKFTGNIDKITKAKTPVYLVTGEDDSYYGSETIKEIYNKMYDIYEKQGLSKKEIDKILLLDIKDKQYFLKRGYKDQHAGGFSIAKDEKIMSWLLAK